MDKNVVFMGLFAILIGGTFGFVPINDVFAQDDNLSVSREDSDSTRKIKKKKKTKTRKKTKVRKKKNKNKS